MPWTESHPGSVPLTPDSLHAWGIPIHDATHPVAHALAHLDAIERERAEAMATSRLRERFILAHAGLRRVLGGYLDLPPSSVRFTTGPHGKPCLDDPSASLRFNLAHSGDLAVVAVARNREVGVDVEWLGARRDLDAIVSSLHPGECADLARAGDAHDPRGIFQCWTRKEAYLKALGTGLRAAPDRFRVSAAPGEPPRVLEPSPDDVIGAWTMLDLDCGKDYSGTVVAEGAGVSVLPFAAPAD